jgi:hypothetical protein
MKWPKNEKQHVEVFAVFKELFVHTNSRTSSRISGNAAAGDARSLSRDDKDGDRDGDSDSGDDDDGKVASSASGKATSGEVASGASSASGSSPRQNRAVRRKATSGEVASGASSASGSNSSGGSPPSAKKPKKSLTALQSAIEVAMTDDRAGTFRVLGQAVTQFGADTVAALQRAEADFETTQNQLDTVTKELKAERAKKKDPPTPKDKLHYAVDAYNAAIKAEQFDELKALSSAAKACAEPAGFKDFNLAEFAAARQSEAAK